MENELTGTLYTIVMRANPPHLGHIHIIDHALGLCVDDDKVLVLIGSANKSEEYDNPLSVNDRLSILMRHYEGNMNFFIQTIGDVDYDTDTSKSIWEENLFETITLCTQHILENPCVLDAQAYEIKFVTGTKGNDKSLRESWAKGNPVIGVEEFSPEEGVTISATGIRKYIGKHCGIGQARKYLPQATIDFFESNPNEMTKIYTRHEGVREYEHMWRHSPFKNTFHATDAVVRDSEGKFLMIVRGGAFGGGKVALAGGFLEAELTHEENMMKELQEETNLDIAHTSHKIVTSWFCDGVNRSSRGRMTTMVFLVELPYPFEKYDIKAGDDAVSVRVCSLKGLQNLDLFSDHAALIRKVLHLEQLGVPYIKNH